MRLLAVMAALAVALTACTGAVLHGGTNDAPSTSHPSTETEDRTTADTPEAPATAEPAATPEPPETVSDDRCGGTLEGCFSYDEMDEYVSAIIPMVQQYFTTTYEELPEPEIVFIPNGYRARTYCGVSNSQAYEYCTGDHTIYIGQDLVWAFYRQAGDAAPAVALAHEWGHHLQSLIGTSYIGSRSSAIAFENQADCVSGAWARYAQEQGWLETDDDLGDVETLMRLIGSRESRARDHGTTAERAEAFQMSYDGGIAACNAYFPDSPLG